MTRFPKLEANVIALADSMIAGYTANSGVFPNANAASVPGAGMPAMIGRPGSVS